MISLKGGASDHRVGRERQTKTSPGLRMVTVRLSFKMDNFLLDVRDINRKYIVVGGHML